MKIKKIALSAVFLFGLAYGDVNSIAHGNRSVSEKVSGVDREEFFYNKGVRDGIETGKRMGYEEGRRDSLRALKVYKDYITSLESGKYLSVIGKITPPRIYQERKPNGSLAVIVKGCEIEGELSPSDILALPVYSGESVESESQTHSNKSLSKKVVSDAVYLVGIDGERAKMPRRSRDVTRKTFKVFPDTGFYRKLFRQTSFPFSVQPDKKIRVMFDNETEATQFVKRYNLKYARDYQ